MTGSNKYGINFDLFDEIPVEISGPGRKCTFEEQINAFWELPFSPIILGNICKKDTDYNKPTPIQKHAIPMLLKGRDLIGIAQTGSGKTAAFLLPVLHRILELPKDPQDVTPFPFPQYPKALILSPTRELAVQIFDDAQKLSHGSECKVCVAHGVAGLSKQEGAGAKSKKEQLSRIAGGCDILIATPGRIQYYLENNFVSVEKLKIFVLDEADKMLAMGFKYRIEEIVTGVEIIEVNWKTNQYRRAKQGVRDDTEVGEEIYIISGQQLWRPMPSNRQTIMFSATFPGSLMKLAKNFLRDHTTVTIGTIGGANTDITQEFERVDKDTKKEKEAKLIELLEKYLSESWEAEKTLKVLVFCEKKITVELLEKEVSRYLPFTTAIHGNLSQMNRTKALEQFQSGKLPIMFATSVAARGLDIREVDHVVNYELPSVKLRSVSCGISEIIADYVQRIGRTGRMGHPGHAISFYDQSTDSELAFGLVKILRDGQQTIPPWLLREAHEDDWN